MINGGYLMLHFFAEHLAVAQEVGLNIGTFKPSMHSRF
jgi:hypothetical protein